MRHLLLARRLWIDTTGVGQILGLSRSDHNDYKLDTNAEASHQTTVSGENIIQEDICDCNENKQIPMNLINHVTSTYLISLFGQNYPEIKVFSAQLRFEQLWKLTMT